MTATLEMPDLADDLLDILRPRPDLSLVEWASAHIWVTEGPMLGRSSRPVAWSPETFPPQTDVIRSIEDPRWSKTILLTAPQAFGKTMCAATPSLLYGIGHRRVPVIYVAGNADLANAQYKDKFRRAIEADAELAGLIYENPDQGGNRLRREFTNGAVMHVVGSESVGNLSGKTAPIIVCDDVQAYGTLPGFGHPADYAATRTGAYPTDSCILVYAGTAGTVEDWLWRSMLGSAFFCPFVACLGCGAYQLLEFSRMQFDHDDPSAAVADTWMRCVACDHHITFDELPAMLARPARRGKRRGVLWVSMPPGEDWVRRPPEGGVRIDPAKADIYPDTARATNAAGFWCNALYWPWGRTWGEHAAEWISRKGNPDKLMDFQQNTLVVPFEQSQLDEDALHPEDIVRHRVDSHRWATVPEAAGVHNKAGAIAVTADVQAGYIWYTVIAWHLATGSSYLVEAGRFGQKQDPREFTTKREKLNAWKSRVAMALEKLWTKAAEGWPIINDAGELVGQAVSHIALIDCGFLRETIQTSCARFNGGRRAGTWLPVEGSQCKASGRVPVWPGLHGSTLEAKTRRRYWESNTNRAKLYLRDLLAIPTDQPGSFVMPDDMPDYLRDTFARHLCAEEWDADKGRWNKTSHANHLLDAMALQLAAALAVKAKLSIQEQGAAPPTPEVVASPPREAGSAPRWRIGR